MDKPLTSDASPSVVERRERPAIAVEHIELAIGGMGCPFCPLKVENAIRSVPWVRRAHVAFVLVMSGFLLQWPALLTLAMFPVLVFMYVRLARAEEREALAEFGPAYETYMRAVPAFVPRLGSPTGGPKHGRAGQS